MFYQIPLYTRERPKVTITVSSSVGILAICWSFWAQQNLHSVLIFQIFHSMEVYLNQHPTTVGSCFWAVVSI